MAKQMDFVVPSSQADQEKIKATMKRMSDTMTIIEGHREQMKAEAASIREEFDIPLRVVNWLARTYHRQNFDAAVNDADVKTEAYEKIFKPTIDE